MAEPTDARTETRQRLASALRAARTALGVSADAIAAELGVARATVMHWETGERGVSAEMLPRLAQALRADLPPLLAAWAAAEGHVALPVSGDTLTDQVAAELAAWWREVTPQQAAVLRWAMLAPSLRPPPR
jgi:transcriptional regulator with XRE-family HTH domain